MRRKVFKRKVLPILLMRTLALFLGKSDDSQMRKTKIFHLSGPCQQEGPPWEKSPGNNWKTCLFEAKFSPKNDRHEDK